MGFKEILAESFWDGVNQFVDSVVGKIEEKSKEDLEEELEKQEKILELVSALLETIGSNGKFDKDLKDKDDIWDMSMLYAIILSGKDIEDTEFADVKDYMDESLKDLCIQWEESVIFLDALIQDARNKNMMLPFMENETLENACNKFYKEILELKNFEGGIFATKKFKKEISHHTGYLSAVCTGYILNIQMLKAYNSKNF